MSQYYLPFDQYKVRPETKYIVVHCSATPPGWEGGVQEIRTWHIVEKGWIDVGYHFVIRRDGTIEPGRPIWSYGAHVTRHNHYSVGICLVGGVATDRKTPEDNFTDDQWKSLRILIEALQLAFYPEAEVLGHRDFPGVKKFCPSFDVRDWMYRTFG